jgi:hypothetical protein
MASTQGANGGYRTFSFFFLAVVTNAHKARIRINRPVGNFVGSSSKHGEWTDTSRC